MEPEIHRAAVTAAKSSGISLNSWVVGAIKVELACADDGRRYAANVSPTMDDSILQNFLER